MKRHIIPAVIPGTVEEIASKVAALQGKAEWIQIDITDGSFAPTTTWPYTRGGPEELQDIPELPKIEMHLMIQNPEEAAHDWIHGGASRILVHQESVHEWESIFEAADEHAVEVGAVLRLETPIEVLDPLIERLNLVQLMSIADIGAYGAPFDEAVIPKIKSLREKYPNLTIGIDGGVTYDRAKELLELGVSNLVVGSAVFKAPDPVEALMQLQSLAHTFA